MLPEPSCESTGLDRLVEDHEWGERRIIRGQSGSAGGCVVSHDAGLDEGRQRIATDSGIVFRDERRVAS